MAKLFREPLLHFLLIGAALFLVYALAGDSDTSESDEQIVVSAGRIQQLLTVFERTWQRSPTREELQGLIDDFVLEEIYYRQAVAMGIDRDDTIIRRRLRQKLEFLTDDMAMLGEATDDELAAYLAENEDKFRESPTYAFQQIYFNPEKHGEAPAEFVTRQLEALRAGEAAEGDPSLLPESFDQSSRRSVDSTFGTGFSRELDELTIGQWHGPLSSGLGLHLIRIDKRTEGRLPELAKIRPIVEREWSNDRRTAMRRQMDDRMREKHDVVIEWPEEDVSSSEADPS